MIAKATQPLRAFNDSGREHWHTFIMRLKADPSISFPHSILTDESKSFALSVDGLLELPSFGPDTTKFEMAKGLSTIIDQLSKERVESENWPGIWDWLAAYYFEILCPKKANGARAPKGKEWYIYSDAYNRQYRHRLAGPVDLYLRHGHHAKLLLASTKQSQAPASLSQLEDEIASRQELSRSRGIVMALNELYLDPTTGTQKSGAVANTKKPGTIRRFCDVMGQFERTFDTSEIPAKSLVELLPAREFGRWLK